MYCSLNTNQPTYCGISEQEDNTEQRDRHEQASTDGMKETASYRLGFSSASTNHLLAAWHHGRDAFNDRTALGLESHCGMPLDPTTQGTKLNALRYF